MGPLTIDHLVPCGERNTLKPFTIQLNFTRLQNASKCQIPLPQNCTSADNFQATTLYAGLLIELNGCRYPAGCVCTMISILNS